MATIDDLIAITTSNELEMKDDERLRRIDGLYNDMQSLVYEACIDLYLTCKAVINKGHPTPWKKTNYARQCFCQCARNNDHFSL